ncbi:MAG: hypothetical protein Q7I93_03420, partial [Syntrophales bacterium]|nr:hypothetical protein [Syntrophales bacterium]
SEILGTLPVLIAHLFTVLISIRKLHLSFRFVDHFFQEDVRIIFMRLHVQFSIWVLLPANQSFHSPYARDRNFSEGSTIIQEWYQTL